NGDDFRDVVPAGAQYAVQDLRDDDGSERHARRYHHGSGIQHAFQGGYPGGRRDYRRQLAVEREHGAGVYRIVRDGREFRHIADGDQLGRDHGQYLYSVRRLDCAPMATGRLWRAVAVESLVGRAGRFAESVSDGRRQRYGPSYRRLSSYAAGSR